MPRFSLALRACTTSALLLVGCQSPVEQLTLVPPPPPSESSLSVEIGGPSRIDAAGSFSWEAFAFNGSGSYQYQWEVLREAGQQPSTTTTLRKLWLPVTANDGDFSLRLTVTSGNAARIQSLAITNCIGGCRANR